MVKTTNNTRSEMGVKPCTVAIFCFVFFGACMLLFGIIFLLSSPRRLDPRIVQYNKVVDNWTAKYRRAFGEYSFNVTLLNMQNSPNFPYPSPSTQFMMSVDTTPDKFFKDYYDQLHKYQALKFTVPSGALYGSYVFNVNFTQTADFDIKYKLNDQINPVKRSDSDETLVRYPLFLRMPYKYPSCDYGFIEDGVCYLVYKLDSICLKVKRTDSGSLLLDREYGGFGCGPTEHNIRTIFLHDWIAAKYIFVNVGNTSAIHNFTTVLNNVDFHLRSSSDPLVYAELITNGSLNFNDFENPGSGLYITTTTGFVGFGSIATGLVLLCPAFVMISILCIFNNRRIGYEERRMLLNESARDNSQKRVWASVLFPESSFVPNSPDS